MGRVPVAGEGHGRPCWRRKGSECRRPGRARWTAGQPSRETTSATAGRATCKTMISETVLAHDVVEVPREVQRRSDGVAGCSPHSVGGHDVVVSSIGAGQRRIKIV